MIRVLALDIDGVLTDGSVLVDERGAETKALYYRDVDAIFEARRRGLVVVLVTGEDTPLVDVIARRLDVARVYRAAKDKQRVLVRLAEDVGVNPEEVCYVADAERDAPALASVGLGLAPRDAAEGARRAADRVLDASGGRGAVAEAVELLLAPAGAVRPDA